MKTTFNAFPRTDSEQVRVEEVISSASLSDEQVEIEETLPSLSSTSFLNLDMPEV